MPKLLDAGQYGGVFKDLEDQFSIEQSIGVAKDIYFGPDSLRVAMCESVQELDCVRMDGIALQLPRRVIRKAEIEFGGSNDKLYSFLCLVFPQSPAVSRLHVAYTHPLMLGRLFLPLAVFQPRAIPQDQCDDQDPTWGARLIHVYAAESADLNGNDEMREGEKMSALLPLESNPISTMRHGSIACSETTNIWVRLASVYLALRKARSAMLSGNSRDARATFESLVRHRPSSSVLAHYAAFCATQGDETRALQLFRESAAANPQNPLPLILFAHCVAVSDPKKATQALRGALELDKYDPEALVDLATVISADGSHSSEAVYLLRRALLLQPGNDAAMARLATLSEPPSAIGVRRADQLKITQGSEKKAVVDHISTYLDHLNFERLALFPGEN